MVVDEKLVDYLKKNKEYNYPLYNLIAAIGKREFIPAGADLIALPQEFKYAYTIDELLPYLMKLKSRRTILDNLYPGRGGEIDAAYVEFLKNPGKYTTYYVPNTKKTSSDGEYTIYYDPSKREEIPRPREREYTFDDINKYKEENQYELKDIGSPDIYDAALAAMNNSMTATATATPPPPSSTDDIKLDAGDILADASKEFLESGGSSRKYLRRRFKKSKSKSKSKKSKSKSKTKPKLKSKSKTKYRKQNK